MFLPTGLNYVIKHVGCIFRRLFMVALDDVKQGEELSAEFKLIPLGLERFLISEFDDMLWDLMVNVSKEVHSSMEPMYSSIDPNLPTFHCKKLTLDTQKNQYIKRGDEYVPADEDHEVQFEKTWFSSIKERANAIVNPKSSQTAKAFLRDENRKRATAKKSFLPDERSAMITGEETDMILQRSFEYIVGLLEFNLICCRFQLNHHLYQGFKTSIRSTYMNKVNEANWDELVQPDPTIDKRLIEIEEQRKGLTDSLRDVQRMQRSI